MVQNKSRDLLDVINKITTREEFNTITVRNVPAEVDDTITAQAKAAGKSKSDFVQEFLTVTFGDRIGNFIRTSELVALMDKEMARMLGAELSQNNFDSQMTQAGHREFCRILEIRDDNDLQRIMMSGVPHLAVRASQLHGVKWLAQGNALYAALLAEAVLRGEETVMELHRSLFNLIPEDIFQQTADELRAAMRLDPLVWSII